MKEMSLIMAIAMLTCASGSDGDLREIDVGTKCECKIRTRDSGAQSYWVPPEKAGMGLQSPHDATGECFDPRNKQANTTEHTISKMDVWRGQAVEFFTGAIPTQASSSGTLEFHIECKRLCSVRRVRVAGLGWCGALTASVLNLYTGDFSNRGLYAQVWAPEEMDVATHGLVYGALEINSSTMTNGKAEPMGEGTPFGTDFMVEQTGDVTYTRCADKIQWWRCRDSFSVVLAPMHEFGTPDVPQPGECVGDCADWTDEFGTTTSSPTTTSSTPSTSSTSSTDEASIEPTDVQHCRSTEDCIESGSWCDTYASVCVSGSSGSSSGSSSRSSSGSSSDSTEETTHCHSDDECRGSQICDEDVFECVDSSSESSTDSSKSSSSDSRTDSSGDSSSASSGDSTEEMTHCHNDDECRGSQICDEDAFECVDSSSDSSSDSSKDSGDGSDSSEDLGSVALRYQRCAARVKELEAWQETLLSMTAAKHIQGDKDEGQGVVGESQSVSDGVGIDVSAYAKEAVIGCLLLLSAVLLAYVCLCKSNAAKNKPVYGGVRCSEEEENLRV